MNKGLWGKEDTVVTGRIMIEYRVKGMFMNYLIYGAGGFWETFYTGT